MKTSPSPPRTHAERLARSLRDARDALLLLLLLVIVLGGWDFWLARDQARLESLAGQYAEVRRQMEEIVTPEDALRALERQTRRRENKDLRDGVVDLMNRLMIPYEFGSKIYFKERDFLGIDRIAEEKRDITQVEWVNLDMIRQVELWRLIEFMVAIKNHGNQNTWCTTIEGLTPLRDAEGFAVVTSKTNDPVFNVRNIRISRFTEIPK